MRVRDLMTTDVRTIGPEATLKQAAASLVEHGVSGLPVCDREGRLLGVLSEGDILYKEHGEERTGRDAGAVKTAAITVRTAMSTPPLTVAPSAPVAAAARLMTEHGVKRLPVVDDGRLVGIVTRTDLVRAFLRTDDELERELCDDLLDRTLWLEPGTIEARVEHGIVTLDGRLRSRSDVELLERLARRIPGVVSVDSTVLWEVDDTRGRANRRHGHAGRA